MESPAPSFLESPASTALGSVRGLLASILVYIEARLRLASLESGEALHRGLGIAAVAMVALMSLIIAYVCGIVALTLWISHRWWDGQVIPVTLLIGGGHLVIVVLGALCVAHASRRLHLFQATLNELTEDKRWLQKISPSAN